MAPFAVVVLAAGAGTRMRSSKHKVLHEAAGAPLLEHVLNAVLPLEPRRTTVVIGHLGDQVRLAFQDRQRAGTITYAEQRELLGTGHALLQAREEVLAAFGPDERGAVLVLNGDGPLLRTETLGRMLDEQGEGQGMTVLTAELEDVDGLGRVVRSASGAVERIVEQKDADPEQLEIREVNAGVYAFDLGVFARCQRLSTDNAQGEQYITELVDIYLGEGLPVRAVKAADPTEILAVNDRDELAVVDRILRERERGLGR